MNVNVLLTSGEVDTWTDVANADEDRGSLVVVDYIEGDEIPSGVKLLVVAREVDQGPDLPTLTKHEPFRVLAVYAPGMWMKVEFE